MWIIRFDPDPFYVLVEIIHETGPWYREHKEYQEKINNALDCNCCYSECYGPKYGVTQSHCSYKYLQLDEAIKAAKKLKRFKRIKRIKIVVYELGKKVSAKMIKADKLADRLTGLWRDYDEKTGKKKVG
jgi:hypothetical protein